MKISMLDSILEQTCFRRFVVIRALFCNTILAPLDPIDQVFHPLNNKLQKKVQPEYLRKHQPKKKHTQTWNLTEGVTISCF